MRRQSQIQSPLERAVRGAENLLMGMCLVNSGRDSTHGMVASKESVSGNSVLHYAHKRHDLC